MSSPQSGPRAGATARQLDAAANRASEGLRVLEDAARFWFDDAELTSALKNLRHHLRAAVPPIAISHRDALGDVLAEVPSPSARRQAVDVIRANAARVQEACRSLSEFASVVAPALAAAAERTRYALYTLELRLLTSLAAWRFWSIRLYVLVDVGLCHDPVAIAAAAARGGAGCIQLRAKHLSVRDYRELAAAVQERARANGAMFVVNDHAAVAAALRADGLHLGQHDLSVADARAVVGPCCAVGVSCHTPEQVDEAQAQGADVVGLGPMFATTTKPAEPERGAQLLDVVRARLVLPSYAIGGLNPTRIAALRPRLPHGVAVAGAVCAAPDPERATAELLALLQDPSE